MLLVTAALGKALKRDTDCGQHIPYSYPCSRHNFLQEALLRQERRPWHGTDRPHHEELDMKGTAALRFLTINIFCLDKRTLEQDERLRARKGQEQQARGRATPASK